MTLHQGSLTQVDEASEVKKKTVVRAKVESNISKLVVRGYMSGVFVLDMTSFFSVPKSTKDI